MQKNTPIKNMSQRLDTSYSVNTPEGITLRLSPAGPAPRFLAWSIDLLLRLLINMGIFMVLSFAGKTGLGIALILTFFLEWFYPVYFEIKKAGQTPGKKSMGLYVAHEDATPIGISSSITRNLLRVVDFLPFFYAFGLMSMLLSRRFQRLGDLVAKTVVLHKELPPKSTENEVKQVIRPPVKLTLVEQQALVAYLQRHKHISPARQEELALLTGSLIEKQKKPVDYLLGIANYLTGGTRK
jgi:uncharacterized RDD family membrane protein YckC